MTAAVERVATALALAVRAPHHSPVHVIPEQLVCTRARSKGSHRGLGRVGHRTARAATERLADGARAGDERDEEGKPKERPVRTPDWQVWALLCERLRLFELLHLLLERGNPLLGRFQLVAMGHDMRVARNRRAWGGRAADRLDCDESGSGAMLPTPFGAGMETR